MKKFQQNVARELNRAYPDRRHLEAQCISCVSFVKDSPELLDCSCWVMVINIVALDMLKSKLPPPMSKRQSAPNLMSVFERSRIAMPEEDPYSLPGSTPRGQQPAPKEAKPPKLPPRDLPRVSVPRPDYEDHLVESNSRSSSSSHRKKTQGYYGEWTFKPDLRMNRTHMCFDKFLFSNNANADSPLTVCSMNERALFLEIIF